tara:strand:- start:10906 stop:11919 length:1014 start_codon:yes stop_codon:yes gene_type:complete
MILLTGATGFVGKLLLKKLLSSGQKVVCLARTPSKIAAAKGLIVLKGDLENADVLHSSLDLKQLENITQIIHLAALYDLNAQSNACYMANVVGTMNLVALSRKMPKLEKFIHISTVAVAGDYHGEVPKGSAEFDQNFPNPYAKTKAQAESIVRREVAPEILVILRLGIVIGDSESGEFDKVDGPYMAIDFFKNLSQKLPILKEMPLLPLPMGKTSILPLVPVDVVVNVIEEVIHSERALGCHHVVLKDAPSVLEFSSLLMKNLGFKSEVRAIGGSLLMAKVFKQLPLPDSFPKALMDYMGSRCTFDVSDEINLFKSLNSSTWTGIQESFFREAIIKL